MSENDTQKTSLPSREWMQFAEFLENCPPNQVADISDIDSDIIHASDAFQLHTPELSLHCSSDLCNGTRIFRCIGGPHRVPRDKTYNIYLIYLCSNCRKIRKTYSIMVLLDNFEHEDSLSGTCIKYGEMPRFGPPTPPRLLKLIGPDRDLFLQGRRCENQGLGIGAFTYYRRVIENQKDRVLGEIVRVATKIGANESDLSELNAAIAETQFSKALSSVKKGIPQTLLIDGQNPLALMHRALSEGIHGKSDHECLTLARSVRVVLAELSERISQALKDEAELKEAVSTLLAANLKAEGSDDGKTNP